MLLTPIHFLFGKVSKEFAPESVEIEDYHPKKLLEMASWISGCNISGNDGYKNSYFDYLQDGNGTKSKEI